VERPVRLELTPGKKEGGYQKEPGVTGAGLRGGREGETERGRERGRKGGRIDECFKKGQQAGWVATRNPRTSEIHTDDAKANHPPPVTG